MKTMAQKVSARTRLGQVQTAVAEGVCKAAAKADIHVQILIERSDRTWRKRLPFARNLSPATLVAVATQIGIAVAGLDSIPPIHDKMANVPPLTETH